MKLTLNFVFILINLMTFAQNGNYRVKYLLDFQKDSLDIQSINREIMYLDVINNESIFQSENLFKKDSISSTDNPYSLFGLPKPEFKYKIIKDNDICNYFVDYSPSHRFYVEDTDRVEWNFINDTIKTIENFKCKLAKTTFKGRNYYAWYTIDIPINSGPYKFNGLPGLVVELFDSKKHYHFQLLSIKEMQNMKNYTEKKKYTKISKQDLIQLQNNIKIKPSIILSNSNLNLPKEGMDKYDNKHRELNKKFNNPIELTD